MNARIQTREYEMTLSPWGFPIACTFEFYPGETVVMWGDAAHPGSANSCQLLTCSVGGVDITEMVITSDYQGKVLEDQFLGAME